MALVGLGLSTLSASPAVAQLATWEAEEESTSASDDSTDGAAPEEAEPEADAEASASEETGESDSVEASASASGEASVDGATAEASASDRADAVSKDGDAGRAMRDLRELEAKNGFEAPRPEHELEWHGGLEMDMAYANYTLPADVAPEETLYDFRGRFVVGPTLSHDLGDGLFFAARAELVGWVRERQNVYQINVDDVYARFGQKGYWDLTAGRFNAWRVYHRGRGFDLYTVEDLGACKLGNCGTQNPDAFGVGMYEVDRIYLRGPYGRVAAHVYPTEWSGIELLGEYGSSDTSNILGGRAAFMVRTDYFRVSAAGEYRQAEPTTVIEPVDPVTGIAQPCPKCNTSGSHGFGGSLEATPVPWIELGFSAARGEYEAFSPLDGSQDPGGTGSVTTYGGFGELDVGHFFGRSVILGGGAHWTQQNVDNGSYESHLQMAAFAAYPLGFNASELKVVASRAQLERLIGDTQAEYTTEANAVRLRFTYGF